MSAGFKPVTFYHRVMTLFNFSTSYGYGLQLHLQEACPGFVLCQKTEKSLFFSEISWMYDHFSTFQFKMALRRHTLTYKKKRPLISDPSKKKVRN